MDNHTTLVHTTLVSTLDAQIAHKHLLTHPFYQAWSTGDLSLASLHEYAKQYYRQVEAFPTYVSAVHSNCPDLPTRQYLLENLIEEERGTENHPELWIRFAEALGLSRKEVLTADPDAETAALVDTFKTLTRDSSYLVGTTALLAYEAQVLEIAETKIDGLKKFYGVNDERGLAFFRVHLEADKYHADTSRQILEQQVSADETDQITSACDQALTAL